MNKLTLDNWEDEIKIMVNEWVLRLIKLGQIDDYVNRKGGVYIFEMPELTPFIKQLLQLQANKHRRDDRRQQEVMAHAIDTAVAETIKEVDREFDEHPGEVGERIMYQTNWVLLKSRLTELPEKEDKS